MYARKHGFLENIASSNIPAGGLQEEEEEEEEEEDEINEGSNASSHYGWIFVCLNQVNFGQKMNENPNLLQVLFIGLVLLTPGNAGSHATAKCQTQYSGSCLYPTP